MKWNKKLESKLKSLGYSRSENDLYWMEKNITDRYKIVAIIDVRNDVSFNLASDRGVVCSMDYLEDKIEELDEVTDSWKKAMVYVTMAVIAVDLALVVVAQFLS
jgi:subtilase family serine protease